MSQVELGFIGAGNMAEAITRGVLSAGLLSAGQVLASDPSPARRELFKRELGVEAVADSAEVAARSRLVILSVKPQSMAEALAQVAPRFHAGTLVVSIAAGITTRYIEKQLGGSPRVVRVMPNTPMLAGAGMSALAKGSFATDDDLAAAERIFAAGGKTIRVAESYIDAVTAVSGSGPAYFYLMVEAMTAAGLRLGLNQADAALLARQTAIGTGRLLEASDEPPAELRRKVTSPGGTTQAAVESFEKSGFAAMVESAVGAAAKRSKELAK